MRLQARRLTRRCSRRRRCHRRLRSPRGRRPRPTPSVCCAPIPPARALPGRSGSPLRRQPAGSDAARQTRRRAARAFRQRLPSRPASIGMASAGPTPRTAPPPLTQPAVEPGASFDYRFRPPDAGTFWYHGHRRPGRSRLRALIVEEAQPVESTGLRARHRTPGDAADARAMVPVKDRRPDFAVKSAERVRLVAGQCQRRARPGGAARRPRALGDGDRRSAGGAGACAATAASGSDRAIASTCSST